MRLVLAVLLAAIVILAAASEEEKDSGEVYEDHASDEEEVFEDRIFYHGKHIVFDHEDGPVVINGTKGEYAVMQWLDSVKHASYEGEVDEHLRMNGRGVYTAKAGFIYSGEFARGKLHGHVVVTYTEEAKSFMEWDMEDVKSSVDFDFKNETHVETEKSGGAAAVTANAHAEAAQRAMLGGLRVPDPLEVEDPLLAVFGETSFECDECLPFDNDDTHEGNDGEGNAGGEEGEGDEGDAARKSEGSEVLEGEGEMTEKELKDSGWISADDLPGEGGEPEEADDGEEEEDEGPPQPREPPPAPGDNDPNEEGNIPPPTHADEL